MWRADHKRAGEWFVKAAAAGHKGAFGKAADAISKNSKLGTPEEMLSFYLKELEERPSGEIAGKIYRLYRDGKSIPKNAEKELVYLKKAADMGDPEAMYDLGYRIYYGRGLSQNIPDGKRWLKKSADSGYKNAKSFLQRINQ